MSESLAARLERVRIYQNELARKLREFRKDLGLCIEKYCRNEASDGVRCDDCQEKSRESVARAASKRPAKPPRPPRPVPDNRKPRKQTPDYRVRHRFQDTGFDACGKCGKSKALHRNG